jgi:hypothetical protein
MASPARCPPKNNFPAPSIIATDIIADLEAALEQLAAIEEDLKD